MNSRPSRILKCVAMLAIASGATLAGADTPSDCLKSAGESAEDICARAVLAAIDAIRHEPDSIVHRVEKADAELAKGDVPAAVADYDLALEKSPSNADLLLFRGRAHERSLDFARAISDLDRGIEVGPPSVSAFLSRGIAHLYVGALPMARADFANAMALDPTYPAAALWMQIARWKAGEDSRLQEDSTLDTTAWPGPVINLFTGKGSIDELTKGAAAADPTTQRLQMCEADFYGGEYLLHHADESRATTWFKRALGECPRGYSGWVGSHAELAGLARGSK